MRKETILYVEGVTVSFDGFLALKELSFYMDYGELRAMIGPNGAGKSTMLDVICGKTRATKGRVIFGKNDTNITKMPEQDIVKAGIGRKFQNPSIFSYLTVFENFELSLRKVKGVFNTLFARKSSKDHEKIYSVLETVGLVDKANEMAGSLSHGEKQWVEIGMVIAQDPELVLLDEPVAGMSIQETERTAELILSISKKHSILVIDHDMDFIRSISQKVTVLHDGTVLCEGTMDEVQKDERVIEKYLGRGK
ncbi:MAG: urea ABC transporter ATP-binding protein UrtD [Candidatus Scalinduaceae bacterium]